MTRRSLRKVLALALGAAMAPAVAPRAAAGDRHVEAIQAKGELPESELLDVSIEVFAPGTEDVDPQALTRRNIRAAVRKSEARYVPIHLRNTLQATGQWGAVRVVPSGTPWADLSIGGRILKSNGKDLEVEVVAWDATGERWLEREYKQRADPLAYAKEHVSGLDPFDSLYNRVANDLVKERDKRHSKVARVHEVARLRFAADLMTDPFATYLATDKKGRTSAVRLPAADDPLVGRIEAVHARDQMFVDTLNEYYSDFYARMGKAYDDWRAYSYQEQLALDSINRSSLIKKLLGAAAILGGLMLDPRDDHGTKDVLILGGIAAVQSGFQDDKEKGIHKAALTELADSFEGDVKPLLVDVDGKVTQLRGSAESQFAQWRELLRRIAHTDAALPSDINVVPAPPETMPPDAPPLTTPGAFVLPPEPGKASPAEPAPEIPSRSEPPPPRGVPDGGP
jgi:hypothetical protein